MGHPRRCGPGAGGRAEGENRRGDFAFLASPKGQAISTGRGHTGRTGGRTAIMTAPTRGASAAPCNSADRGSTLELKGSRSWDYDGGQRPQPGKPNVSSTPAGRREGGTARPRRRAGRLASSTGLISARCQRIPCDARRPPSPHRSRTLTSTRQIVARVGMRLPDWRTSNASLPLTERRDCVDPAPVHGPPCVLSPANPCSVRLAEPATGKVDRSVEGRLKPVATNRSRKNRLPPEAASTQPGETAVGSGTASECWPRPTRCSTRGCGQNR